MCLIAFALGLRKDCPLLLASNRDEFWDRPTLSLSTWSLPGGAAVTGGRDLRAGGTWLGFNDRGRVAMLTNVRTGEPDAAPLSRGELVTRWLAGPLDTPDWFTLTHTVNPQNYGGFNLVLGDLHQGVWVWLSNAVDPNRQSGTKASAASGWVHQTLGPGLYGLSNAGLDTPWPKTRQLKAATAQALDQLDVKEPGHDPTWQRPLLDALLDTQMAPDDALPSTGIPLERERALSSPFVYMPDARYGTRSSLLAHWRPALQGGLLTLEEWTHAPEQGYAGHASGWPLARSTHKRISMSMCGMPTSS